MQPLADRGISVSMSTDDGKTYQHLAGPEPERSTMPKSHEQRDLIGTDIRELERAIANAYVELESLKEAKDEARQEHQEGQERLNALVGELTRRVNGEQPLPL